MTEAPSLATVTHVFDQWRTSLERGELLTATHVAGNDQGLVAALQQRINEHFSYSAAQADETRSHADEPPAGPLGINIPGFTFHELLGRGGMGAVFRVRNKIGLEWAMKVVRPDRLTDKAKSRFYSEALAMAKLRHPNLIEVQYYHEAQTDADVPYMLMPIYPTSLYHQFERVRADRALAVRVLAGIAAGVAHLHEHGLMHRDLKPHNVLLTANDVPIVSDFGLVKDLAQSESSANAAATDETYPVAQGQTAHGTIMGTRRYMSPEQAAGQTQLTNPTWDVWAIGVLAHELLVGDAPASSDAPHRLLDPATPDNAAPRSLCPTLEPELERILQKCLARHAEDRYPTAAPLAADLHAFLKPKRSRRAFVGTALAAVLACILLAVALWPKRVIDPKDELLATLARDGKATLIGADRKPKYRRFVAGEVFATEREWISDQAYSVDTQDTCLLELVPADLARQGRLRIQADIRINRALDAGSLAGLYVGHKEYPTTDGVEHLIVSSSMRANSGRAEQEPTKRTGSHGLYASIIVAKPTNVAPANQQVRLIDDVVYPNPFRGLGVDSDWHTMTVEVDFTSLQYAFDGQTSSTEIKDFERGITGLKMPLGGPKYVIQPPSVARGCGLLVYRAHASYRAVTVELLPPD